LPPELVGGCPRHISNTTTRRSRRRYTPLRVSTPVPILTYATPAPRRRWGPIFFAPSRAALLCLAVATLAWVWLYFRHAPWREVMAIHHSSGRTSGRMDNGLAFDPPRFTPDNLLVTSDNARGTELWDPRTRQRVRHVSHQRTAAGQFYAGNARFVRPDGEPAPGLYDVRTGAPVGQSRKTTEGPSVEPGEFSSFLILAPDGSRRLDIDSVALPTR